MTVLVKVDSDLELEIHGKHYKGEEENNISEYFEISEVKLYRGSLDYLMECCNNLEKGTLWEAIEELVLNKINS